MNLRIFLLHLGIVIFVQCTYIVPSNVTGRYDNIYFPESKLFFWQGQAFSENILIAPKTFRYNNNGDIDFCKDLRTTVAKIHPSIWKNASIGNPCESYFCSTDKPYFLEGATTFLNNTISVLTNNDVLHTLLMQYCVKCSETYQERFDLTLLNRNCSWYNGNLCLNYCPSSYDCFYFSTKTSLCYSNTTKIYYGKVDYIHTVLAGLRFFLIPSLFIISNIILFIIASIFIVIPELGHLRNYFNYHRDLFSRLAEVFSMRNQSITAMMLIFLGYMIFPTLDLLNFTTVYFSSAFVIIQLIQSVFSWLLIFLIWLKIYNITTQEDDNRSFPLFAKIFLALIYIITFIFMLFIIAGVVISPLFQRSFQAVTITIVITILTVSMFLTALILTILSIRLLRNMTIPSNEQDNGFYFFKLKLTRSILIFNVSLIPLFIASVLNVVSYYIIDYFSISFQFFFMQFIMYILSILFSCMLIFTLIHNDKFLNCFCKKIKI